MPLHKATITAVPEVKVIIFGLHASVLDTTIRAIKEAMLAYRDTDLSVTVFNSCL